VSAVQLNYYYETAVRNAIDRHDLPESPAEFVRKAGVQRINRLNAGEGDPDE
jgi:hypothetical protein